MALPTSRNTTYVAGVSEVKSADLNDMQDWIVNLYGGAGASLWEEPTLANQSNITSVSSTKLKSVKIADDCYQVFLLVNLAESSSGVTRFDVPMPANITPFVLADWSIIGVGQALRSDALLVPARVWANTGNNFTRVQWVGAGAGGTVVAVSYMVCNTGP